MSSVLLTRILKRQKGGHEGEKSGGAQTQEEMGCSDQGFHAPSPTRHTSPHGADCSDSARSISSTFLQSLSCLRIRSYHWNTLCAVTGGDNSAVMSKRELDCQLTEERRDNLQPNVCINMYPKFLTCVLILKLGFRHYSSSLLLTLYSPQHHLSPLTTLN